MDISEPSANTLGSLHLQGGKCEEFLKMDYGRLVPAQCYLGGVVGLEAFHFCLPCRHLGHYPDLLRFVVSLVIDTSPQTGVSLWQVSEGQ